MVDGNGVGSLRPFDKLTAGRLRPGLELPPALALWSH